MKVIVKCVGTGWSGKEASKRWRMWWLGGKTGVRWGSSTRIPSESRSYCHCNSVSLGHILSGTFRLTSIVTLFLSITTNFILFSYIIWGYERHYDQMKEGLSQGFIDFQFVTLIFNLLGIINWKSIVFLIYK